MKTYKFRVAKAGQTCDGRNIPVEAIEQMAESYDPKVYGARINLEHYKAMHPDSAFKMYGDVISLETEVEDGETYLVAEILPTEDLKELAKAKQKVYFSIECDYNFADTGTAYLMGLACTDNPASLGTSYMTFCQPHPNANPFSARKTNPNTVFSTAEFCLQFPDDSREQSEPSFTDMVTHLFKSITAPAKHSKESERDKQADDIAKVLNGLPDLSAHFSNIEKAMVAIAKSQDDIVAEFKAFKATQAEQENELQNIQSTLDSTVHQDYKHRPPATGSGADYVKTDC